MVWRPLLTKIHKSLKHFSRQILTGYRNKKLFTPGPLGVSPSVRNALNLDMGSRDEEFIAIVKNVRDKLVAVSGLASERYTCVLMQGSGTFAIESVLQTTADRSKKVLIAASGAYGRRAGEICAKASIPHVILSFPEHAPVSVDQIEKTLKDQGKENWGALAIVHCETTSGVLNPIQKLGKLVKSFNPEMDFIVDAMSSFGGVEEDYRTVDYVISSGNKCLQGVPGLGFIIANKEKLTKCKGKSVSLSLDLYEQWIGLETNGQFRFTPPTHVILGLNQALIELELEGGVRARAERYMENNRLVKDGLGRLGFSRLVKEEDDCHIITSFKYPTHSNFNFQEFYNRLSDKGLLIYPGKVTNSECFRVGNIGHLFPTDMKNLVDEIGRVLADMDIPIPLSS